MWTSTEGIRTRARTIAFFHLLDRYLAGDVDHVVWAFAVAALKLHLDNSKIKLPSRPGGYTDFRDALNAYVDVLANREPDARSPR